MRGRARRHRAHTWAGAALALALAAPAQAALTLQLDARGLGATQVDATAALVRDVQARLPTGFGGARDRTVTLRWSDALAPQVHGRNVGDEVRLNRQLLADLTASPARPEAARAALLHELAHVHDRDQALSRDPRLLDLAGWQVRTRSWMTRLAGRTPDNRFVDRSPDTYELTDPAEFVAVNLEHFVLDPEYACRRPALYRYFRERVGAPALSPPSCAPGFAYVDAGAEDGQDAAFGQLDPERVYAVEYLLAEGNDQMMSRWGHSMLRLVVCAPGRPRGPDCRLDLAQHRVLSFRAFVGDVQLSSWRGLTGRYPSRLFVLPLTQVVDEYTKVELRGLQSIPLRLSDEDIAALVERAAQLHWSYDGRYYFLGNNCATETWKLLHDAVPRLADANLGSITPTGLLRRLERAGVADASVLDDPTRALREGYRFDSLRERFQNMYDVAREGLSLQPARVEEWMALSPGQRQPWLQQGDLKASAALLLLEQAALRREQLLAQDELKRRYLGHGAGKLPPEARAAADTLQQLLHDSGYLGRPAQLLDGAGYGLPQAEERQALAEQGTLRQARLQQQRTQLWALAQPLLSVSQRDRIAGIEANASVLSQRLRTLHREQGGLTLP